MTDCRRCGGELAVETVKGVSYPRCKACKNARARERYLKKGKLHLISGPIYRTKNKLTLAYLAGMIDADGFISAHKRNHNGRIYCGPLIGIAGTDPAPHQLAHSVWGGSLTAYTPKNPKHRLQHQWQCVGLRAATAIKDILPYLLTKRRQAEIAIEMWEMIDAGMHRTDDRLLAMATEISSMNLRKPPTAFRPTDAMIPPDLMIRQWPKGH